MLILLVIGMALAALVGYILWALGLEFWIYVLLAILLWWVVM